MTILTRDVAVIGRCHRFRMRADPRPADAGTHALAWLGHAVSVTALVTLLLNDHLGKLLWPGLVTGKISDVAGLVMFPPLLATAIALITRRVGATSLAVAAIVLTGAGFALAKTTPAGAHVASAAWSLVAGPSVIRADASDLWALPALAVAWWAWSRRRVRVDDRTLRWIRILILVPVALLATAATSAATYPETIWVGRVDGKPAVGTGLHNTYDTRRPMVTQVLTTNDGGATFRWWDGGDGVHLPSPLPLSATSDCLGATCYRVVTGQLRVQMSGDTGATWTDSWAVTGTQYRKLAGQYDELKDPALHLSSVSVLMVPAIGGSGYTVLVANGRDGLLRRDETGAWTRLGNPEGDGTFEAPVALTILSRPSALSALLVVIVVNLVLLGGLTAAIHRARPFRLRRIWFTALAFAAIYVAVSVTLPYTSERLGALVLGAILATSLIGVLLSLTANRLVRWFPAIAIVAIAGVAGVLALATATQTIFDDSARVWVLEALACAVIAGVGAGGAVTCGLTVRRADVSNSGAPSG